MGVTLSKNAQLIKFFAQLGPGIPRTRLVKMAYMADVISRRYLGRPISDLEYRKDKFGPNAPEIGNVISELEAMGLVWTKNSPASTQEGRDASKMLFDSGRRVVFDFTLGENEILAYVAENYRAMELTEFVRDVVKQTRPFKAQRRFHEPLPMDLEDNEGRNLVGFDLEAIARAERQAEAGDFRTARDFFDALRTRLTARYTESH